MRRTSLGVSLLLPLVSLAAAPPGIPDGWLDGYAYANGVRIHYYHAPAPGKPAIVMVHGVTDIGLSWTTLTVELQDHYDVYMLDARAHGLSDPFTEPDDGNTLVKDVVAFVRSMDLDQPILMGHSMGAATVMRVGAEYPDLARAIIMLDPGVGGGPPPQPPRAGADGPAASPEREASAQQELTIRMRGTPEVLVAQNNYDFDALVARCGRNTPKWDPADCQYWALSKQQYHGPYTEEAWQAMYGTMQTGRSLANILVPALILKADAPAQTRQAHQEAASVMRNGKLVHIDGAGHNLHHDELARTLEALNAFLSRL